MHTLGHIRNLLKWAVPTYNTAAVLLRIDCFVRLQLATSLFNTHQPTYQTILSIIC